ncbi:DUF58 domain-containing protein [Arthrobacter sp. AL12]|uniref:DUF58 domain-containing protein n=1 Tax=Arthrobacter sp. AL12 TaxID=3042241 RepID=UPI002499C28D|nr:DUF58 domain-containing protein [Arthrobacter sp. AL12]MDI3211640.1 DUF58 domain-containing protein [Arthrobacter sp. AL12]
MASLLQRVKSKLSIHAHRKARGLLEGQYGSVSHGRSLDFDDLRAYVPGDEVRDIDWKATARHGSPLVRRYVAARRQTLLLVTDTGRNMAAESRDGEPKGDIAVLALGVVGYLAHRHGDAVGLVCGDSGGTRALPGKAGEAHLERLLRAVHDTTSLDSAPSRLETQLDYVVRNFSQRMLLLVVADELLPDAETERLLRRLRAQHEILWLTVRDAELLGAGADSYDVASTTAGQRTRGHAGRRAGLLPGGLAESAAIAGAYARGQADRDSARQSMLRRLGIAEADAGSSLEVIPAVFTLLARRRRGR